VLVNVGVGELSGDMGDGGEEAFYLAFFSLLERERDEVARGVVKRGG